jgi:selenocysteine-specific elongation factor
MKRVIVGTAGHIDHGKTELIKALTGVDTDRLPEEKRRGITIDLGFAPLRCGDDLLLGIIDVPGHERFVHNMLAGASGIDIVLLVVAADEGVMPQTREHLAIARLLGTKRGIISLTKKDLVDEDSLALVLLKVEELVKGSFLEKAPIIPTSIKTGDGIAELKEALAEIASEVPQKKGKGFFRLPIDRVFTVKGFGTVVTGTLVSGRLKPGDDIELLPSGKRGRVRGLEVFGKKVEQAVAGERTAVNITPLSPDELARGEVILPPATFKPNKLLDVSLSLLPDAPFFLDDYHLIRLHLGTAEVIAKAHLLSQARLLPGEKGLAQLILTNPIFALPGDRFVIRSYSPITTIGGGRIIDNLPQRHRGRKREVVCFIERIDSDGRLLALIGEKGRKGTSLIELRRRNGSTDEELITGLKELVQEEKIKEIAGASPVFICSDLWEEIKKELISFLSRFHQENPLAPGIAKEELKERAGLSSEVGERILVELKEDKAIEIKEGIVFLAGFTPTLSQEEKGLLRKIEQGIKLKVFSPPPPDELLSSLSGEEGKKRKLFNLLLSQGKLVKITTSLIIHRDNLDQLVEKLRLKKGDEISISRFKEMTGLSRKYAIPLLEYLDKTGITERRGNIRIIK